MNDESLSVMADAVASIVEASLPSSSAWTDYANEPDYTSWSESV